MTEKEIIGALRCCADYSCSAKCPAFPAGLDCREKMHKEVLALLERLTAENAALKKEIRKAGCMFCARFEDRPEGVKPVSQEDCDNCTKKPDCACKKCSGIGSSTDNWEWRGAPEEGGKA